MLKSRISPHDIFVRKEIVQFSQMFNDRQLIEESLRESEAELLYARAAHSFKSGNVKDTVKAFAAAVGKRNELEKPEVQRLLRMKLQTMNTQRAQIKKLREEIHVQREILKEYAHEYYLMGNECITKAHDPNAAIRSFDKALRLYPEFVDAWVRKGVTLLDMGDGFQALTCLNEAVRLNPKSFKARYNRGKSYLQLKYYDEAVSDFMKAVDLKPKHAAAHEYLAEAFLHIGEEELARQHQDIADELRNRDEH